LTDSFTYEVSIGDGCQD